MNEMPERSDSNNESDDTTQSTSQVSENARKVPYAFSMIEGFNGWSLSLTGLQYFCFYYDIGACKKFIKHSDWTKMSAKKISVDNFCNIAGPLMVSVDGAQIFCDARPGFKCKNVLWTRISNWNDKKWCKPVLNPLKVSNAFNMIKGFKGWSLESGGIKYNCFYYHLSGCKKIVGNGLWTNISATAISVEKFCLVAGPLLMDADGVRIFCNAKAGRKCTEIENHPWRAVSNWNADKWCQSYSTSRIATTVKPIEVIDVSDVYNMIHGFNVWSVDKDGSKYYCYYDIEGCNKIIGNGKWKEITREDATVSVEAFCRSTGPLLVDAVGALVFCNVREGSKCNAVNYPWKKITNWNDDKWCKTTPITLGHTIDVLAAYDNLIQGFPGWTMDRNNSNYACFSRDLKSCSNMFVGSSAWRVMDPASFRVEDFCHIGGLLVKHEKGATAFCRPRDPNKGFRCSLLKGPMTRVLRWNDEAFCQPRRTTTLPTTLRPHQPVIGASEAYSMIQGFLGWTMDTGTAEYKCFAFSIEVCQKLAGKGPLMMYEGGVAIFCNAVDLTKSFICMGKEGPWTRVVGWESEKWCHAQLETITHHPRTKASSPKSIGIGQYVFEETFNLRFGVPFEQHNATLSSSTLQSLPQAQLRKIRELNALDLELYEFARTLMYKRFNKLKSRDPQFSERFANLGRLPGRTEFNWDQAIEDTTITTNT
ncbi:hypothetical protein GE061_002503 [Apolygus lucorum]|uniref:Heparan-sulfate 6-O-sulfotransferase n=1 Tax=Apolygus lucorum TaxID=248454 RepID=A0A6A4JK27_APOLU|nr:hypothetical protein GE061_002503 [Apolygus lucorum]